MTKTESVGVTHTEQFLAELCGRSFLRLWSYANPYKDDAHEFCDVLGVFENHVFIFFDREKHLPDLNAEDDPEVKWARWKRATIDRQVVTAHGAERYIRSGRKIYLDACKTKPFPIPLNLDSLIIHKIIVAHGADSACKNFDESNVYGSLAISYGERGLQDSWPFMIHLDRNAPVHVFDTHNLPIILGELDTVKDFSDYLDAKAYAISRFDVLSYCGEEDLLAHYWLNFDPSSKKHFIGTTDDTINGVMIGEGEWHDLIALPQYQATKEANQKSYLWDEIIQKTCDNWLAGVLLGDGELLSGRGAIHEMAKEPRFMRREAAERMFHAIEAFPDDRGSITRHLCFFNSYYPDKGYVFLQFWAPPEMRPAHGTYRAKRQELLRIACGVAKNRNPHLKVIVGIAISPPKFDREIAEDFIWLDCDNWSSEQYREYESLNSVWNFFGTGVRHEKTIREFVSPHHGTPNISRSGTKNPGRNEPCYCGSGKKYKKCHGR